MVIICPNQLYAHFVIHIFAKKKFDHLYHYFSQAISFEMITKHSPMVNQSLPTQLLKFPSKFCALIHEYFYGTLNLFKTKFCAIIHEYFCWITKSIQYLI